uniref:Uncharacterized protein n=1 Tax=Anguilla anguilla TaxID=7936 RepID=A0A0E9XT09_ANGAN
MRKVPWITFIKRHPERKSGYTYTCIFFDRCLNFHCLKTNLPNYLEGKKNPV